MSDAIVIDGVTKRFDGRVAVDDLSLTVPRGALYGFIGPNGSGKTTTLRMIMNILYPDRGTLRVLGLPPGAASRELVSYLPEERGLYKRMTVRAQLRYFAALKGRHGADIARATDEWLRRLEIADRADVRVETLSKGLAQKVQFAAAVVSNPSLVILDEPLSGLDPVAAEVLRAAILHLRASGATVVLSTHDMATAEQLCDRIFMIFRGRKVLDGTLAEIQAAFGQDVVRVRTRAGRAALDGLPGVAEIVDRGNHQELRLGPGGDPQAILAALAPRTAVEEFVVAHPSLHDIFVRIARPTTDGVEEAA